MFFVTVQAYPYFLYCFIFQILTLWLYGSVTGKQCNLYLEGLDQFSGWFYSSLLTSVALTGAAPYKVGRETSNQCWGSGSACFLGPPGSRSGSISQRFGSGSGSFLSLRCWTDWNNAYEKIKFYHKILANNYIFKTEDYVPAGKLQEKSMENFCFWHP